MMTIRPLSLRPLRLLGLLLVAAMLIASAQRAAAAEIAATPVSTVPRQVQGAGRPHRTRCSHPCHRDLCPAGMAGFGWG